MSGARELTPLSKAQLGQAVGVVFFVELQLEVPVYSCTAAVSIEADGKTWIGVETMRVGVVSEQSGEIQQLQLTLPAVPNERLGLALATPTQGKPLLLYLGLLHPGNQQLLQPPLLLWTGRIDTKPVTYGPDTAAVNLTAEHRAIGYARPKPLRYTDADQRRLYPGDACLECLVKQSQAQDVWPSAEYFRK